MKKNILIIVLSLFLVFISFSGCLDEKNQFIGTWEAQNGNTTLVFKENNNVSISGDGPLDIIELTGNFEYLVGENTITFSSGSFGVTLNYQFPESDELVLSNDQGNSVTFIKQ